MVWHTRRRGGITARLTCGIAFDLVREKVERERAEREKEKGKAARVRVEGGADMVSENIMVTPNTGLGDMGTSNLIRELGLAVATMALEERANTQTSRRRKTMVDTTTRRRNTTRNHLASTTTIRTEAVCLSKPTRAFNFL